MDALLRQALERAEEVARALADPATARDPGKLQSLGREHSRLAPIQRTAERLARLKDELAQARELAAEGARRYPHDQRLQRRARILAPRALGTRPADWAGTVAWSLCA